MSRQLGRESAREVYREGRLHTRHAWSLHAVGLLHVSWKFGKRDPARPFGLVPYLVPYRSCLMRLMRLLDALGERG